MFINGIAMAVQGLLLYRRQVCREIRDEHEAECKYPRKLEMSRVFGIMHTVNKRAVCAKAELNKRQVFGDTGKY